jgi:hypothetical protein
MLKNKTVLLDVFFYLTITVLIILNFYLALNLPFTGKLGGPDEPMHISMVDYLNKHHHWPSWDSDELLRYVSGSSYATGSSIVYWWHAFMYSLFDMHRWGSVSLFLVLMIILIVFYQKSRVAGYIGLLFITPQVLFVFSYVNADVGVMIVALLLGIASTKFIKNPLDRGHVIFFFVASSACITARMHMWVLGFIVFLSVIVITARYFRKISLKTWIIALSLSLLVASWWPITSYYAHDGAIVPFKGSSTIKQNFGNPDIELTPFDFRTLPYVNFTIKVVKSFYGTWGWMNLELEHYIIPCVFYLLIFLYIFIRQKWFGLFYCFLFLANYYFLVLFAVTIDYQYQGRYLFPAFFLTFGMSIEYFKEEKGSWPLYLSIILMVLINFYNIYQLQEMSF